MLKLKRNAIEKSGNVEAKCGGRVDRFIDSSPWHDFQPSSGVSSGCRVCLSEGSGKLTTRVRRLGTSGRYPTPARIVEKGPETDVSSLTTPAGGRQDLHAIRMVIHMTGGVWYQTNSRLWAWGEEAIRRASLRIEIASNAL